MGRENAEAGNLRARFEQLYPILKSELLQAPSFKHQSFSDQWIEEMLAYNVPGGKLNPGLSVVNTYILLKTYNGGGETNVSDQNEDKQLFLASVLGWCIQWLLGCALVLDDIMDNSTARPDRPRWFCRPQVGMIAVNYGVLLWSHINMILKKHFRDRPYYVDLLELFNEVEFHTTSGEMLGLITGDPRDLSLFTPENLTRISKYKTAYGTFYLPFACALILLGESENAKLENYLTEIKEILLEMGVYFQVQDDYLDCYGDVENIGSDIEDFKCSWLIVKALELSNEEQRKKLYDNYGKVERVSVEIVKGVYEEVELQRVYDEYEIEVFDKLMTRIEEVPNKGVQAVLTSYLAKIHKREK